MINIFVYEDSGYQKLMPLTMLRPVYDLRLGILTLFEKAELYFGGVNLTLLGRDYLKQEIKCAYPNFAVNHVLAGAPGLFINGRVIVTDALVRLLSEFDGRQNLMLQHRGEVVAIIVKDDLLGGMKDLLLSIPSSAQIIEKLQSVCPAREVDHVTLIEYPHDLVHANLQQLESDFAKLGRGGIVKGNLRPYVVVEGEQNVYVGENTTIEDFVTINATAGPVYIESDVYIESHTRLEGPLFIGKGSRILGGKISRSSIGPNCKVAGEVSNSIFLKNTNKAHAGFIGHSYLGEWVNLGAHTTGSNLKNTYGEVKFYTGSETISTGQQFLGCVIGDHAKLGIQSTLTTGTHIGFGASISGTAIHPNFVPPFAWGTAGAYGTHRLPEFMATVKTVMKRRGIVPRIAYVELLEHLHHSVVGNA